jgi:hypothetical protein
MEAEKAEDIEEVEDVERAKGRTSSRMGITGAAKFARRCWQNGTRNFNLKNVWQVKEPAGAFFECVARKEASRLRAGREVGEMPEGVQEASHAMSC